MTKNQLIGQLREMYDQAEGKKVVFIHLFGIMYAGELSCFLNRELDDIAEAATGHRSYGTEISKGRALAPFVEVRKP